MINDIPPEIIENIYKRLDGKSRFKFRMAMPISSLNTLQNRSREKNVAMAERCIKKHGKKNLPYKLKQYLKSVSRDKIRDSFVLDLCRDCGIEVEATSDILPYTWNGLTNAIRTHKLTKSYLDEFVVKNLSQPQPQPPPEAPQLVTELAKHVSPTEFDLFMSYPQLAHILFSIPSHCESFIFTLVNYDNQKMLEHLIPSVPPAPPHLTSPYLSYSTMKSYMHQYIVLKIFVTFSKVKALKLILKFFPGIPTDILEQLKTFAEEEFLVDMIIFLDSPHLDKNSINPL